ncbi:MAG TPA: chromate transporter [Rectinema sp.]|jgi:chromate transporter|nr:chromate transporter [Spirochaetia bacterium]MDI9427885.1 chromate transporter [Spirochaetota bacterium]NLH88725.1 chromate transporter [Treponema sp.]OQC73099.1 MAG: Chromate transport protein [Spirochaetes bacterium ADurb.Bin001]HNP92961.1 chromate transporter [Rectinema sp.]
MKIPSRKNGAKKTTKKTEPTPLRIFLTLAQINTLTLGGGYVIVPVIGNSFKKQGWIDEEEFYRIFSRAQVFPGPIALSTSFLCSYKIAGVKGAIAAVLGVVLPPFIALILVGGFISLYGDTELFKRFLKGAGAVVPGLVGSMLWKTAKNRKWTTRALIEVGLLTILLVLFPSAAFFILIGGIVVIYLGRLIWKS